MSFNVCFAKETILPTYVLVTLVCAYLSGQQYNALTGDTPRKPRSSPVSLNALYVQFGLLSPHLSLSAYSAASHCSDSCIRVPSFRLLLCVSLLQVSSCMQSQPHTHSHCPSGAEVACSQEAHTEACCCLSLCNMSSPFMLIC